MAASIIKTHARVTLDFIDINKESCWFLLVYSELPKIYDVAKEIRIQNKLETDVVLHMKNRLLPEWERSLLIKDEDNITVTSQGGTEDENTLDQNGLSDARTKRKRKKHKDNSYDECNASFDADIPTSTSKKKRKRKDTEQTQDISIDTESTPVCTSSDKTEQNNAETVCYAAGPSSSNIDAEKAETESNKCDNSGLEETEKKRKRIRKHRKRNKAKSEPNTSNSISEGHNKSVSNVTEYKGRVVGKGELFFGSIPDKLLNPNYYRHGYRNLKAYEPIPNKHQVFKSDEEDNNVQQNTEQYNFLSSTKILEDREQNLSDNEISAVQDIHNSSFNLKSDRQYVDLDNLDCSGVNSASEPMLGENKCTGLSDTDVDQNKQKLNESDTNHVKNNQNNNNNSPQQESTIPLHHVQSGFTDLQHQAVSTETVEAASRSTPGSSPAPTVLTRKLLPNGVAVFVRQRTNRANSSQPVRELSKGEQLNTTATNKSTIFKVPMVEKSQSSSPIQQKLLKMTDSDQTQVRHQGHQNGSPNRIIIDQTQMMRQPSPQTDMKTSPIRPDQSADTHIVTNGRTAVGSHSRDYSKLPQLKGVPEVGMLIAYKVLEMSLNCTPEVSAYKEAEVLAVDSTDMVTLKNILPNAELKYNKFHVEIEDEEGVLTSTTNPQEQITMHTSSMLETRIIKKP